MTRRPSRKSDDAPRPKADPNDPHAELRDNSRGERIQKVLAFAGVASRRDCEALIANGRVNVNGKPLITLPAWVDPWKDRIEVNGVPLPKPARNERERFVYIALHKPRSVISTAHDPEDRRTVTQLVNIPPSLAERVFPVGRLDADSTGLILMTNDGELANRLTHPRYGIAKRYMVALKGKLTADDIEVLKRGIILAHPVKRARRSDAADGPVTVRRASVSDVTVLGYDRGQDREDRTKIAITLQEGQNREIRRVMARLGFKVHRLQRVAIGPITLKGLPSGEWRLLTGEEIDRLKRITGMNAEQAAARPKKTDRPDADARTRSRPRPRPRG